MELIMFIGNDCVEAVNIEESLIVLPGYLGDFVKMLKCKYEDLIRHSGCEPEFLIHNDMGNSQTAFIPQSTLGKCSKACSYS